MDKYENLKIIAFVGLPGSGKSTAVKYLTEKNIPKVYFGGIVLDAMEKEGIERTPENEQKFRENMRREGGPGVLAKEIIKQIDNLHDAGQHHAVADGLYSWSEYKLLKETYHSRLTVVAIFCPKHLRHHRLSKRTIRPLNEQQANERDYSEIEHLEKGGPIAIADYTVINDAGYDEFYEQIDSILSDIDF